METKRKERRSRSGRKSNSGSFGVKAKYATSKIKKIYTKIVTFCLVWQSSLFFKIELFLVGKKKDKLMPNVHKKKKL